MMIRKLYPRLHLSEAAFRALPECGLYGPVGQRIGTLWKSRFTDGWFIGVWTPAGGYSYEVQRRWHQPVIRCAREAVHPACELCREPVSDDALDTAAWELRSAVAHARCTRPAPLAFHAAGQQAGKIARATTERMLAEIDARVSRYG
jgi:hypothetical protein